MGKHITIATRIGLYLTRYELNILAVTKNWSEDAMKRHYFLLILLALGCGVQGSSVLYAEPLPNAYFPLAVGNQWVYESSEGTEAEPIGESWKVTRQEGNAFTLEIKQSYVTMDSIEEFFVSTADGVGRLDDQTTSAETTGTEPQFFLKAPLAIGATWNNTEGTFEVTAVGKTTTIPAGTFTNCVEVTRQSKGGRVTVVTLYAPGVGVVQQEERFPIISGGLGSFDRLTSGGAGGSDTQQQGQIFLQLKEWKLTSP